jgi:UDP-N-acetylglucosamine 1-carboxyvinyltransferase
MDQFVINGGIRLRGSVRVRGARNAALPLMAACILADGESTLRDVPDVQDVTRMARLLDQLGVVSAREGENALRLEARDEMNSYARYEDVHRMRASLAVLGPLLAKRGSARISLPGGSVSGDRPVDLHLRGLQALGADVESEGGDLVLKARKLRGADIFLCGPAGPSVLATANCLMAAVLTEGTTVIEAAACEPEITDLVEFLNQMGAQITGANTHRLVIEGVDALSGAEHTLIPDRIEAGTFMIAAAISNGEVEVENVRTEHLVAVTETLRQIGLAIERRNGKVNVSSARRLDPADVTTWPYPGFPTDLQGPILALLTLADGTSVITEKVFPERFAHVPELRRLGAQIRKEGPAAIVQGVRRLGGAPVTAADPRASAALILAGLAARGTTVVHGADCIDRGYEALDEKLAGLGADIRRVPE